jgi:hypothetical protein
VPPRVCFRKSGRERSWKRKPRAVSRQWAVGAGEVTVRTGIGKSKLEDSVPPSGGFCKSGRERSYADGFRKSGSERS